MKVKGSTGQIVDIEVLGINDVIRRLQAQGKAIIQGADLGVVRAGAYVEEEVKMSIAGQRAEPRSVRTGLFANSIKFEKVKEGEGIVKPDSETYPGTTTTTEEVAIIMEGKRHHFQNTKIRTEVQVKDIIENEVKQNIKS